MRSKVDTQNEKKRSKKRDKEDISVGGQSSRVVTLRSASISRLSTTQANLQSTRHIQGSI